MAEAADKVSAEIVDAARNFFLRFGYSRVSTGEIASSIGRSKKTLYKAFENKESLLLAVLGRLNGDAETSVVSAIDDGSREPAQVLEDVLQHIAVNLISTQDVLFADLRAKSPELHQQARSEREAALLDLLVPLLQRSAAEGHLRHDVDFHQVVTVFIATIEGLAQPIDLAAQDPVVRRRIDTFIRLLVDGLRFIASESD